MYLWPERLPGALEELHLLSLYDNWLGFLAWAPRPCQDSGSGLAGRLPRLHTLRVMRLRRTAAPSFSIKRVPLLDGFPVLPTFEVDAGGSGTDIYADAHLFGRVRYVCIVAGGFLSLSNYGKGATFMDCLCPAGLQAAELCAGNLCSLPSAKDRFEDDVVRELISRFGDRYAVEVGLHASPGEGYRDLISRLAWRRWPARGTPDLQAARAAHERARAWAAAAGQQ